MKSVIRTSLLVTVLVCSAQTQPAFAIDKVYSPNVTKGEFETEYGGSRTFDGNADKNNAQEHEIELEYGLTNHLQLELSGSFEREPYDHVRSTGVGFGGRYQFFDQGQYWLDAGLLMSYGHSTQPESADSIEAKLLLEKQTGSFLHRANIGIEQEVGKYSQGGPDRVVLWNSRYRLNKYIEPGFEIQSDFGKGSDHLTFDQQEHYIGPAIYGQIIPNLKYEAVYYRGLTEASSSGAARVLLEYEMYF